ncbi:MAG: class I SAM-dependent methyltransferase [Desulfurococcaceae archaeon]
MKIFSLKNSNLVTNWASYYAIMRKGDLFPDYESKIILNFYKNYVCKFVKEFLGTKNLVMLELGSGIGRFSLIMAEELKVQGILSYVVGIDIYKEILVDAKRLFKKADVDADFVAADVRLLPFREGCFDFVHSQGLHEHFSGLDRDRIFSETKRVLRKSSLALILVPNKFNIFWTFSLFKAKLLRRSSFPDENPFTVKELSWRVRKAGLIVLRIGGINNKYNFLFLAGYIFKLFSIFNLVIKPEVALRGRLIVNKSYGEGLLWLMTGRELWAVALNL